MSKTLGGPSLYYKIHIKENRPRFASAVKNSTHSSVNIRLETGTICLGLVLPPV